jgi:phage-related protein (TIGR01555 family)
MPENKEVRSARNKRYYAARKAREAVAMGAAERKPLKISDIVLSRSRHTPEAAAKAATHYNPFKPYQPAPGIKNALTMAMDSGDWQETSQWAQNAISSAYQEGQEFLGYPELALMAQRAEYRVISETIAEETTRCWIRFNSVGDDDKSDKIEQIESEFRRLNVRDAFKELAEQDGFFGRSHLYLDTGDSDDANELATPMGDGRNKISQSKVGVKDGLRKIARIKTVEPVWTYPREYNSSDPLSPDWYKPDVWLVMGKTIHASRLLTFIGREVPDLLKPAYSFGGLSLTQMAKPYVQNWLDVRQATTEAIKAYSVFVLETDLSTILTPSGDELFARADLFNNMRNNRSLMIINKTEEAFQNVSQSLAGLHELQAQAQEHMAAVCKIPLVKLLGISPTGLNASSEGEMRSFNDMIHAYQERLFRQNLTRLLGFVQLSLFGEVDPEIDFEFENLTELTDKESAEVRKMEAETDQILIDTGVISPEESRKRVAGDNATPYAGLDVEDAPDLLEEEAEGLVVQGGLGQDGLGALFDASKAAE